MTTNVKPLSVIAKCALCSVKTELFVCSHCDEVICKVCVDKHQFQLNETLEEQWSLCQTKFADLCQSSGTHDPDVGTVENEIDRIRTMVDRRQVELIQWIENEKSQVLSKLEEYVQVNLSNRGVKHSDLQRLFDSIDQRLTAVFQDFNISYNIEDFLLEIQHLNSLIHERELQIQTNSFKYPYLIPPRPLSISNIFGELQWNSKPMSSHPLTRPSTMPESRSLKTPMTNGHIPTETIVGVHEESATAIEETPSMRVSRRQKQWVIDAAGVPHFLCTLSKKNCLLFACDKYGSIDLYQLDSNDPRHMPRHLRQFELFPGNTTSPQPQIIETFTVYTPFIVVSAHSSDQTDTSSVYFFDHRGVQQGETCLQNFPVRQLSADVGFKCLWGVDRYQHSVYYNQLPTTVQQIPDFIEHRQEFLKFSRDFEPIRITQNQTSIAVVERNSQSAHIFDKESKKQTDEVENLLRKKGVFRLWNVLLRDDNSMVLKLDEDLPPNSRPPSINHLILELDRKGVPISQIERTSVYGLAIGPNEEILLGCKKQQQNGLIECYI